jgi:hypothetical protein
MAENKKSFLLYCDIIHTVSKMPDDKAGKLFKHILEYVNDMSPETEDLIVQLTFEPIKQQLKRDLTKWESNIEQRRQAGIRSAESRKNKINEMERQATTVERDSTKSTVTDTVTVTVTDIVKEKKEKNIYIPDFSEFKKYALDNQCNTDLKKLELKYKSWVEAGWIDGNGKKISNWKSKLLNTLTYLVDENIRLNGKPKLSI